jgi:hypothetical protein
MDERTSNLQTSADLMSHRFWPAISAAGLRSLSWLAVFSCPWLERAPRGRAALPGTGERRGKLCSSHGAGRCLGFELRSGLPSSTASVFERFSYYFLLQILRRGSLHWNHSWFIISFGVSCCGPYDFYCTKGLVPAENGLAPTAGCHPQAADAPAGTNPLSATVYVQSTFM